MSGSATRTARGSGMHAGSRSAGDGKRFGQLRPPLSERVEGHWLARGRVRAQPLRDSAANHVGPAHAHQRDIDRERVLLALNAVPHAGRHVEHRAWPKKHLLPPRVEVLRVGRHVERAALGRVLRVVLSLRLSSIARGRIGLAPHRRATAHRVLHAARLEPPALHTAQLQREVVHEIEMPVGHVAGARGEGLDFGPRCAIRIDGAKRHAELL
eukprot:scaffold12491_cov24-Tisochrysis_lutea.AAC.4